MFPIVGILLSVSIIGHVSALEPYPHFREGSCSKFPIKPVNADRNWVHSLEYVPAWAKYQLYRLASSVPHYHAMREDELYYDACTTRNSSGLSQVNRKLGIFGFGRTLALLDVTTRPGIYAESTGRDQNGVLHRDVLTVTLTDHKSFAFFFLCHANVDQGTWVVATNTPKLDASTQRRIENHAASLGFNRKNFAVLRYETCHWGNPLVDHHQYRHHDNQHAHHY